MEANPTMYEKMRACFTAVFFSAVLYVSLFFGGILAFLPLFCLLGLPAMYYCRQKVSFVAVLTGNLSLLLQIIVGIFLCIVTIILALGMNIFYSLYLNISYIESLRNSMASRPGILYALVIVGLLCL